MIERLDHLNDGTSRSLGVSAVWLSPIYPSPNRDVGYDVADYTAIDPALGDLEDFDALVAACRAREIHVVMDLVLNHTSDLHPWFEASRAGRESEKRDWYIWRDPGPSGRPPNNWRSFFGGGPAWTYDEESGQFYLHTFLAEQPDLNWQNPAVREAALDVVRFWLGRGVSGFRLDVFNAYFKHPELPSNPRRLGRTAWARQRHVYNKDRPEVHDFLAELRELLDAHDAIAIGETFEGDPELAASYCDKLHMAFNFDILSQRWSAKRLQSAIRRWDRLLRQEHLWPSYVPRSPAIRRSKSSASSGERSRNHMIRVAGGPTHEAYCALAPRLACCFAPGARREILDMPDNRKECREDRGHRWKRPHRPQRRQPAGRRGARSGAGVARHGRRHHHGRGPCRCGGGR